MLPSSKLLPATIVAIAVVLATKSLGLVMSVPSLGRWQAETALALTVAGGTAAGMIPQAHAAAPDPARSTAPRGAPPKSVSPPASPPAPAPEKPVAEKPVAEKPAPDSAAGGMPAPRADAVQPVTPPAPDPSRPAAPATASTAAAANAAENAEASGDVIKLRRGQIDERERQVSQREAAVSAADKRLAERVAELVALQSRLQGLETALKQRDEANWAGLVKLYEGMRPREAAAVFNDLDKPVLLEILDRMKPAKAGPVLAAMDAQKASQVTADLAGKRTRSITTN